MYSDLNLLEKMDSCFALGQKNKYSKLQQGDGALLNGQSADIDDRASAANGVPA
jgi:hypothetical protein